MFTSLGSIDIVARRKDGRAEYVQTDHRTAEEIEAEAELSVVFALVRVLNPRRMAKEGEPEPVVIYHAREEPPAFLRQAIAAAGGRLTFGNAPVDAVPDVEAAPPLAEVLASAFAALARRTAEEHEVELTQEGLEVVEAALAETAGDPEEDEYEYWSAVLRLGGFGGEIIRASNGGHWAYSDSGTLPMVLETTFRGGRATVNPLGKAIKRFGEGGEGDSLVGLVGLVCSQP